MKRNFYMTIALAFLLIGIPASGFSSSISVFSDSFEVQGFFIDEINIGTLTEGTYKLLLEDTSDPAPGFMGLVLSLNDGSGSFFDNLLYLNQNKFSDSLDFYFDGESALTATIIGMTNLSSGLSGSTSECPCCFDASSFSVELASIPVPASVLLLGSGLVALATLKRKKLR